MKRLIFAIILLVASLDVHAATGLSQLLVTNVNALDFKVNIDATNAVTNIVKMNLSRSQFQAPVVPGDVWTLTNITGVYGGSTNITTNSIWGIDGSGHITPIVTNSAVIATNIVRDGHGVNTGSETWQTKSYVLTNGVNYLPVADYSQLQLISPSSDPSLVQIVLSNGWNTVQHLEIFNLTNAVPSQGAFTLTNLTPIPDSLVGGVVKLINNENWVATNGCGIELRFITPDWVEQFRSDVSGNPTFISNTFNNITVISNTTLRGRITINNINVTTNTLWITNIVGGLTNLQPVDLTLPVFITNRIAFGPGDTNWLHRTGQQLIYEADSAEFLVHGTDNLNYTGIHSDNSVGWLTTTAPVLELQNSTKTLAFYGDNIQVLSTPQIDIGQDYAPWGNLYLTGRILGTNGVKTNYLFSPSVADGVTPYRMDTDVTHASGNLFEWANNATNKITGGADGIVHANRFYATVDPANSPSTAGGLLLSSAGSMFAYATNVNEAVSDSFGISLWNTKAATALETNQYSTPLWWKGSWYDTASHDLRMGLFLKASGSYANSRLQMISSTNGLLNNVTNFAVSANSGYDGTGNLFLSSDGTYKAAGGGGIVGTMIYSGAATTTNRFPMFGDTTGTNLVDSATATGAIRLPSGTTAQEPGAPAAGMLRWNTDTTRHEFYNGSAWVNHVRLTGDTMTGQLIITNSASSNTVMTLQGPSGGTNDVLKIGSGGTNHWRFDKDGNLLAAVDAHGTIGASGANRPSAIFTSGGVTANGNGSFASVLAASGSSFITTARSQLYGGTDGYWLMRNNLTTDFTALQFGGTTSSFPEVKKNGAGFDLKTADDSAYVPVTAKNFQSAQGSLTHAGTVTLDFTGATTVNSLTLTGALTLATSNLSTNRNYRLKVIGVSTNATLTLPSWVFLGGTPTVVTASKVGMFTLEAWGANDTNVIASYAEQQ